MRLMKGALVLVTGWLAMNCACAQFPREQLNQLVTQLQANAGDTVLRERIIQLAREIKPPPAVPEEARRHFVEGAAIARAAQNAAQQVLAVQSFQQALGVAPWWGDAWYNLAVAQELAGQIDPAQESLRLYILTNPGEKEAREAQDRIYTLNARKRLAVAAQNSPEAAADRDRKFLEALEGGVWVGEVFTLQLDPRYNDGVTAHYIRQEYVVRNRRLMWMETRWDSRQSPPVAGYGRKVTSAPLSGRRVDFPPQIQGCSPHTIEISQDGRSLAESGTCHGRSYHSTRARSQ